MGSVCMCVGEGGAKDGVGTANQGNVGVAELSHSH